MPESAGPSIPKLLGHREIRLTESGTIDRMRGMGCGPGKIGRRGRDDGIGRTEDGGKIARDAEDFASIIGQQGFP